MTWIFWIAAIALFYSIVGYGLAVVVLARFFPRREPRPPEKPLLFSFLIPAHNEAADIEAKIRNTLEQDAGPHAIEVIVLSDGSTDGTPDYARRVKDARVQVHEFPDHVGKATAINFGLEQCRGDVVVFSDANSLLEDGSLLALARHFGDPEVGGVCGRITVQAKRRGPTGQAENLYWAYDQAIKAAEIAGRRDSIRPRLHLRYPTRAHKASHHGLRGRFPDVSECSSCRSSPGLRAGRNDV